VPLQYSSSFLSFLIVKVAVKARKVTVTGPRGTITKDFSHNKVDIRVMNVVGKNKKGLYVRIQMWNGAYKQACTVTTFKSLISNMMIGVTEVSLPAKIFENTPMVLLVCFSWTILFSPNGILNYNMVSTSCFLNIGIQIQNENGACPFPNQLHYLQGQEPS